MLANPSWCVWTAQKQAANTFANCWRMSNRNVFADCFYAVHTPPTWVCQHEFANFSLPCEGRFIFFSARVIQNCHTLRLPLMKFLTRALQQQDYLEDTNFHTFVCKIWLVRRTSRRGLREKNTDKCMEN